MSILNTVRIRNRLSKNLVVSGPVVEAEMKKAEEKKSEILVGGLLERLSPNILGDNNRSPDLLLLCQLKPKNIVTGKLDKAKASKIPTTHIEKRVFGRRKIVPKYPATAKR